jgi:hypothetical protein
MDIQGVTNLALYSFLEKKNKTDGYAKEKPPKSDIAPVQQQRVCFAAYN